MLDQVKEKNSKIFVDHFNEVFGERFDVTCDWGFPVVGLEFGSKNPEYEINWRIAIDVVKPDYTLQTFAARVSGEGEEKTLTPEYATIDKATIDFIVGRSVMLSNNLFGQETTETETVTEESTEDTPS
jgi:hypothetical protein